MDNKSKKFKENQAKVIARAWKDPAFKKKLLSNPQAAFSEMGCDLPKNCQVRVIEDTSTTFTFVLPPSPTNAHGLTNDDLEQLAGGGRHSCVESDTYCG